jgi:hypothetical protein
MLVTIAPEFQVSNPSKMPLGAHARHRRTAVAVNEDGRGFVTVSTGLAGRTEMSIQIAETKTSAVLGAWRRFW